VGGFCQRDQQAQPGLLGDVALQVIAVQSGGLALTAGNDIAAQLQKCLADSQAYYEISFAPSLDQRRDAYHHIEVRVAKRWRGRAHSSGLLFATLTSLLNATSLNNRYFDVGRCFRRHSNQAIEVTSD